MGMLDRVTTGKIKKPHLLLIYGVDGIGKSSFAAGAPKPIFLGTEDGTDHLDVARFPCPESWPDVGMAIQELYKEKHDYKTLVIDSLDWLEPLLYAEICKEHGAKSIELAAGGYGKGYVEAAVRWEAFIKHINRLRIDRQMNVILIAHSELTQHSDAANQITYDKFQLKLHKKSAPKFREWVDSVLFANFEVFAKTEGKELKAFGSGARKIWTEGRPGYDAKNRLGLPECIDLSWDAYVAAIRNDNAQSARNRIDDLLKSEQFDDAFRKLVIETVGKAQDYLPQLLKIEAKLKERLDIKEPTIDG
jgi:hypothetical protein